MTCGKKATIFYDADDTDMDLEEAQEEERLPPPQHTTKPTPPGGVPKMKKNAAGTKLSDK